MRGLITRYIMMRDVMGSVMAAKIVRGLKCRPGEISLLKFQIRLLLLENLVVMIAITEHCQWEEKTEGRNCSTGLTCNGPDSVTNASFPGLHLTVITYGLLIFFL